MGRCYRLSMPTASSSPLDGTARLVVDGTNLLYRLGRGTAAPPAAIIGRVRAAIPATVVIELVFDGMGHGITGRVAQQMHVRYSGRRSGDDTILDLAVAGAGDPASVLVVSNDRELRFRLLAVGVRTVPLVWLTDRLNLPRLASPAPGNRRPPTIGSGAAPSAPDRDGPERPAWKPGRGATAKSGPAHKVARHRRHPRHP